VHTHASRARMRVTVPLRVTSRGQHAAGAAPATMRTRLVSMAWLGGIAVLLVVFQHQFRDPDAVVAAYVCSVITPTLAAPRNAVAIQIGRQRTETVGLGGNTPRWGHGNMQCGIYLRKLWASRHVSKIGALEATYYLLQPWPQLVGSLHATSWRVFCRIVRRRREWFKARRNAEFLTDIEVHSPPAPVGGIQVVRAIMGGSS
jgi:hypothetical protein